MNTARRNAHYVLSTHWDREWYLPFQAFRFRLVQLLDAILDGMSAGVLHGPFTSDGQALMIEDYLEVRPERRAELAARARAGMLAIGPWYSVPDEFLVGGESLVRNLRMGLAVARSFGGEPSRAGWVCDQFGHISQLPQIFAGFGIRGAFLWRGVNAIDTRHFRWRGADGTILPTYRFGDVGYCSFAFRVRRTERPDLTPDYEQLRENLEQFLADEAAFTQVEPLLIFDGGDHLAWDEAAYRAVAEYGREADQPFALRHSSLDQYLAELLPQADRIATTISGELREPASMPQAQDRHWLIPGVLASRVWIKQENAACESLLLDWAEPLSAWAYLALGHSHPPGLLDSAWRWLLQNHPHDSMGGCSVDQVHADMRYRFSQSRQIAAQLADAAAQALAAATPAPAANERRVVIFNPLPRPLSEVVTLDLEIPSDWPQFNEFFGFEPQPAFRIFDSTGAELSYQRLRQAMRRTRTAHHPLKFPAPYQVHMVRVALQLAIPPLGYTTLNLRPGELDALPPHPSIAPSARPTRHPARPGLAISECAMENALLRVTIEPNGSLSILDKRSGASYQRLLSFEDSADIGDGWYHGVALADEVHSSAAAPAQVALLHDGPQLCSYRIRKQMRLPARFDFAQMRRSDEMTELVIDSVITLRRDSERLEVETSLRNTVADHRLRVLFPSGAPATTMLSDGPFDVLERPIALRADNHTYRELEVETRPQLSWTAVQAEGRGLAVISSGLLECAVRDLPERPIALTLLRSTRRTVLTDGEPDGLLLNMDLHFRYWIVPLSGEPDRVLLHDLGRQLAAGLRVVHVPPQTNEQSAAKVMPANDSLLTIDGPLALSSLRRIADYVEVRIFNPNTYSATATLRLPAGISAIQPIDLEGSPLADTQPLADGNRHTLTLSPKQIMSLRLLRDTQ